MLFPSVSLKHLKLSLHQGPSTPLPIIPSDIVAYGFVGKPFSKELYISLSLSQASRIRGGGGGGGREEKSWPVLRHLNELDRSTKRLLAKRTLRSMTNSSKI